MIGRRPISAVPMPIREPKQPEVKSTEVMPDSGNTAPQAKPTAAVVTPDTTAFITDAGGTTYIPLASPPPPDSTVWDTKAVPFPPR